MNKPKHQKSVETMKIIKKYMEIFKNLQKIGGNHEKSWKKKSEHLGNKKFSKIERLAENGKGIDWDIK